MKKVNIVRKSFQLILFMFILVNVHAQNTNTQIGKEEIINKSWKAMFGELKQDDIKSIYVETLYPGKDVAYKMIVKRPDHYSKEMKNSSLFFDGKRAARKYNKQYLEENPKTDEFTIIDSNHWMHFEVEAAFFFPAIFDFPSVYKGVQKVDGKDKHEFFVEFPLGAYIIYFIDAESFLITKRFISWEGNPEHKLAEHLVTDYIDYNGIKYPDGYSYDRGEGRQKVLLKNVKFNINPSDELFQIPLELDK